MTGREWTPIILLVIISLVQSLILSDFSAKIKQLELKVAIQNHLYPAGTNGVEYFPNAPDEAMFYDEHEEATK
jgi:hypothetical protein